MKNFLKVSGVEKRKNLISIFKFFFAQEYFHKKPVLWMLSLSFVVNLMIWASILIWIDPVDLPIILHYNVYFGVDIMGDWRHVFTLPGIGLLLWLVNAIMSLYFFRQQERIATYLLLMAGIMIQLSLLVAAISVIIINY